MSLEKVVQQQSEQISQLMAMLSAQQQNTSKGGTEEMAKKLKYGQGSIKLRTRQNKKDSIYEFYEIKWYDEYGIRHSTSTKTKKEAEATLSRENPRSLKNKTRITKTFGEYFQEWYNAFGNAECGPARDKSNLGQIKKISADIMNTPLASVTAMQLQTHINSIEEPNPKVQIKQLMRACLKYAFINGHIKVSIGESLKADLPVVTEKQVLPREIEDKFISMLPEEYQPYAIGLIYTGTRISEFFSLNKNWQTDIDYEKKIIKIRETKSLRQKDLKAGITYVIREAPLLDPVANIKFPLKECKKQTINKNFNKVQAKLNKENKDLNLKITPHCMRHTFITRCDELGINETASMSWTGHKTNKMHRRYKHKTTKIVDDATKVLMKSVKNKA